MAAKSNLLLLLSLILSPFTFSSSMTTITALIKDQIACTMCSSCQNPCQPVSPPPPPGPNCPPPPSPPTGGGGGGGGSYYFPPPSPVQNYAPPYGGGAYYPPTNPGGFPTPPPPNPIVPYFPYYYYNPPMPSSGWRSSDPFHSFPVLVLSLVATVYVVFSLRSEGLENC